MTRYLTPGPAPPACLPWCDDHDAGEGLCRRLLAEAEYDDGDTMEAWLIGSCHNDVVTLDVDGQRIEHPDEAKLLELFGLGLEKQLYVSHDVDVASPGAREKGHMSWCELAGDHRMCHRIIYQDECDDGTPDEQGFKVMFFGTPGRSVSMWIGYAADGAMYDIDKTVALRKILSEWVPRIHFWHGASSLASPGSGDKLKLAGRIPLDVGEELVGSDIYVTNGSGVVPMALTRTSAGPRLRVGTGILDEDKKRWAGRNLGSTVNLDANGMRRFRAVLDEMHAKGDDGGRRFRAIEDREDELDQRRREILMRQHRSLSKADAKRLDRLDRRIEELDDQIAHDQKGLRNSADWLAENDPIGRARWDEIDAEIAALDPLLEEEVRYIGRLQVEQARLVPSFPLERIRAIPRMQKERQDLDLERQELTADATPLSAQDQADLTAVDAEIASNHAQHREMAESILFEGAVLGEWTDLAYEVTTRDTATGYDDGGISYRIAARPKDADEDWDFSEENGATDFEPKELAKLAAMLDRLTGTGAPTQAVGELLDMARSQPGNRQQQQELALPSL